MARKKQYDYFEALQEMAVDTQKAATYLKELMYHYSIEELAAKAELIHDAEHAADDKVTEIMHELYDAFITPIDREDIANITEKIDDVIDGINGVVYSFENLVITSIPTEAMAFSDLIVSATDGLLVATKEFAKFKNSKTLNKMIEDVNKIEWQADCLYSQLTRDLFIQEQNPVEIIKWKDLLDRMERIVNACEDAVDIIAQIVIKNI